MKTSDNQDLIMNMKKSRKGFESDDQNIKSKSKPMSGIFDDMNLKKKKRKTRKKG